MKTEYTFAILTWFAVSKIMLYLKPEKAILSLALFFVSMDLKSIQIEKNNLPKLANHVCFQVFIK